MSPHPFLDSPTPIALAHRGGAAEAAENTLEAFRASYGLGYRWLETDVHLTRDAVVAAFHDPRLDRVTDRTGDIEDLDWEDVGSATVAGTGRIPSMEQLLTEFPDARFNIDTKSDRVVVPLLELIEAHDAWDRVCLGSFVDRRLDRARSIGGDRLCTSAGPREIASAVAGSFRLSVGRIDAHVLQIPIAFWGLRLVTRRLVRSAHEQGLAVHVWTIDRPDEMRRLLDIGVDGIMTDRPSVLREVMLERGLWQTGST